VWYATLLKTKKNNEKSIENKARSIERLIYKMAISYRLIAIIAYEIKIC
jgi:hypothetical protein